jgi:predicted nucleic acid-binding protein
MRGNWVVDTGPLSHFARAGWLGVLPMLAPGGEITIPDTVQREIQDASGAHVWLADILHHDWIRVVTIESVSELRAYSHYARRLVGDDGRNTGECGVLALAEVHGMVAIIDDSAGYKAGTANGVSARRTLGLLCDAVENELLTLGMVSAVADSLLQTDYRLPFLPGGFAQWAAATGRLGQN